MATGGVNLVTVLKEGLNISDGSGGHIQMVHPNWGIIVAFSSISVMVFASIVYKSPVDLSTPQKGVPYYSLDSFIEYGLMGSLPEIAVTVVIIVLGIHALTSMPNLFYVV